MTSLDYGHMNLPAENGSKLRTLLFRDAYRLESPSEIVQWWERRRVPFNIVVGSTGLVSLTFLGVLGAIGPNANNQMIPPVIAVLFYGVLANVCYTSGWMVELALRPFLGAQTGTVGATLFRYGTAFSVGITALPIGLAIVEFTARMLTWMF